MSIYLLANDLLAVFGMTMICDSGLRTMHGRAGDTRLHVESVASSVVIQDYVRCMDVQEIRDYMWNLLLALL